MCYVVYSVDTFGFERNCSNRKILFAANKSSRGAFLMQLAKNQLYSNVRWSHSEMHQD